MPALLHVLGVLKRGKHLQISIPPLTLFPSIHFFSSLLEEFLFCSLHVCVHVSKGEHRSVMINEVGAAVPYNSVRAGTETEGEGFSPCRRLTLT